MKKSNTYYRDLFYSSTKKYHKQILGEKSTLFTDNVYMPQFLIMQSTRQDGRIILSANIGVQIGDERKILGIKRRIYQQMRHVFESKKMHIQPHGETRTRKVKIIGTTQYFSQQVAHFFLDPNK